MFRPTETMAFAIAADKTAFPARSADANAREPGLEFGDLQDHSAGGRNRGSYYVFRQGMLEIRAFDRQTIGW